VPPDLPPVAPSDPLPSGSRFRLTVRPGPQRSTGRDPLRAVEIKPGGCLKQTSDESLKGEVAVCCAKWRYDILCWVSSEGPTLVLCVDVVAPIIEVSTRRVGGRRKPWTCWWQLAAHESVASRLRSTAAAVPEQRATVCVCGVLRAKGRVWMPPSDVRAGWMLPVRMGLATARRAARGGLLRCCAQPCCGVIGRRARRSDLQPIRSDSAQWSADLLTGVCAVRDCARVGIFQIRGTRSAADPRVALRAIDTSPGNCVPKPHDCRGESQRVVEIEAAVRASRLAQLTGCGGGRQDPPRAGSCGAAG